MITINADDHPLMRLFHKPTQSDGKQAGVVFDAKAVSGALRVVADQCILNQR